jgi:hypothetical protein
MERPLLDTARIVRDGALLSVAGSTYLLLLLRFNCRIFLRHYPKELRKIVPPKSKREMQMSVLLGVPFALLLLGAPYVSTRLWQTTSRGSSSFWELFAHGFGVFFFFNLVDLLVIDWLIVCWYAPSWVILPGTEHIVHTNPYLHHFKGFLIGTASSVFVGFAIAALLNNQF